MKMRTEETIFMDCLYVVNYEVSEDWGRTYTRQKPVVWFSENINGVCLVLKHGIP